MSVPFTVLSIDEYHLNDNSDLPTELVRGRIVEHPFPTSLHGFVCGRMIYALASHERVFRSGWAVAYSGIVTARNPDTVRGADASFYSFERMPRNVDLDQYPPVPPEIVFEVKDRADSWTDLTEKVAEYLHAGVNVVCVIDPEERVAVVQTADAPPRTLSVDQSLEFPTILPGFQVQVAELLA